jgi:hypothetical protein
MKQRYVAAAAGAFLFVLAAAMTAEAQDRLATVKALYSSAAYEEALAAIERLGPGDLSANPNDSRNLDEYRALCLLALGRDAEAGKALEDVVKGDPFFLPAEQEVSPRVMTLVHEVRHRLLPGIVQQRYQDAKAAYDRKEYPSAVEQFTRLLTLMSDPDINEKEASIGDLRTLAGGFLDLSKAAAEPPKPAESAAKPASPPPPPPKTVFDASDEDVNPPVVRRQEVPTFPSSIPVLRGTSIPNGVLELLIDEEGRVVHASMIRSIHPVYDQVLLAAAVRWQYKPATRNGKPVKYRRLINVEVNLDKVHFQ